MIKDKREGDKTHGATRSPEWDKVRKAHLKDYPNCAVCGGDKKLQVHHIRPFHLHPNLELDPTNLITLCENGNKEIDCHIFCGHLGSFKSYNVNVEKDAQYWLSSRENRPLA